VPSHTASAIGDRFFEEQRDVQRYVDFVLGAAHIWEHDVAEISAKLTRHGLQPLSGRRPRPDYRAPYSLEQLENLRGALSALRPELEKAVSVAEAAVVALGDPPPFIDARSRIGEWAQFFLDGLEHDASPSAAQSLREQAREQERESSGESGSSDDVLSDEDVDLALRAAHYHLAARRVEDLEVALRKCGQVELAAKLLAPASNLSVLRQAFILLVTAFDAAVFDLARHALQRDFFGLIAVFAGKDKVDIGQFSSFEALRDSVTETQLRQRYLRDILFLLHRLDPSVLGVQGDEFAKLIEMVQRRNVHVHNRGIVDHRYLDADGRGVPRYNVFKLSLGSVAAITPEYWESVNALCETCVRSLIVWASNPAKTSARIGSPS